MKPKVTTAAASLKPLLLLSAITAVGPYYTGELSRSPPNQIESPTEDLQANCENSDAINVWFSKQLMLSNLLTQNTLHLDTLLNETCAFYEKDAMQLLFDDVKKINRLNGRQSGKFPKWSGKMGKDLNKILPWIKKLVPKGLKNHGCCEELEKSLIEIIEHLEDKREDIKKEISEEIGKEDTKIKDDLQETQESLRDKLEDIKKQLVKIQQHKDEIGHNSHIKCCSKFDKKIKNLQNQLNEAKDKANDNTQEFMEKLRNFKDKLKNQDKKVKDARETLEKRGGNIKESLEKYEKNSNTQLEKRTTDSNCSKGELKNKIEKLEEHINELDDKIVSMISSKNLNITLCVANGKKLAKIESQLEKLLADINKQKNGGSENAGSGNEGTGNAGTGIGTTGDAGDSVIGISGNATDGRRVGNSTNGSSGNAGDGNGSTGIGGSGIAGARNETSGSVGVGNGGSKDVGTQTDSAGNAGTGNGNSGTSGAGNEPSGNGGAGSGSSGNAGTQTGSAGNAGTGNGSSGNTGNGSSGNEGVGNNGSVSAGTQTDSTGDAGTGNESSGTTAAGNETSGNGGAGNGGSEKDGSGNGGSGNAGGGSGDSGNKNQDCLTDETLKDRIKSLQPEVEKLRENLKKSQTCCEKVPQLYDIGDKLLKSIEQMNQTYDDHIKNSALDLEENKRMLKEAKDKLGSFKNNSQNHKDDENDFQKQLMNLQTGLDKAKEDFKNLQSKLNELPSQKDKATNSDNDKVSGILKEQMKKFNENWMKADKRLRVLEERAMNKSSQEKLKRLERMEKLIESLRQDLNKSESEILRLEGPEKFHQANLEKLKKLETAVNPCRNSCKELDKINDLLDNIEDLERFVNINVQQGSNKKPTTKRPGKKVTKGRDNGVLIGGVEFVEQNPKKKINQG